MNSNEIIKVLQVLDNDNQPITEDDGKKLYSAIQNIKKDNTTIILDFEGIDMFTTAVINNSIAPFIEKDGIQNVSTYLKISNLKSDTLKRIANLSLALAQARYEAHGTDNKL